MITDMSKLYLWQEGDFSHFYHNPEGSRVLEEKFQEEVSKSDQMLHTQEVGFDDVFTEEIVANSEIEGVILDRESVHSSSISNLTPVHEKEQGAVALTQMALAHCDQGLSHDLLRLRAGELNYLSF
jgi:hypothetical protein